MTVNNELSDDKEPSITSEGIEQEPLKKNGGRQAFRNIRRELSDDELAYTGVQKLLLADIERLESDITRLSEYQDKFFMVDKKAAVLEEKNKVRIAHEVISMSCISLGGASLGYAPAVWSNGNTGYLALGFGMVLIICGIWSKVMKS